ncbi:putative lumazine-binding protein [Arcicella aurantiaca]|uniref:Putative lumazine-binding protein n=1 Tax=Arcicella aurantiaca TaxID=591202 RepID=A0A316DK09_9BACT|nr:nuclear transport factor 2 family protein [Arcicella aurantiaca]PWK17003.1 putative lumazine-binding protein [Arcicella aurantiaca]
MKISKIILFLFFISASAISVQAQSEDEAVKFCVNNYLEGAFKGDAAKVNQAFHSSAVLKSINASGAVADMPVSKFVGGMPAGGMQGRGASSYKIISYSYIGSSALATVEIQFPEYKFIDLLSLLKVGSEWKIVSRVYSKADLDAQVKGMGVSTSTSSVATAPAKPAVKKSTANVKPKADDGW